MSAGIILVDRRGRVLLQLRDDNPKIMYPGHWGIIGGAAQPNETPEQAARRETAEETGLTPGRVEPFRAYYFNEKSGGAAARATSRRPNKASADYELYLFHAPCETPLEAMTCGEGQELRFFGADDVDGLDIAYNHREVLDDFFSSPAYERYVRGDAFDESAEAIDPVEHFRAALDAGEPWFDALMQAVALWQQPEEQVGARHFRYLIGGEAFDWLLLAERLLGAATADVPADEAERLLFEAQAPDQGDSGRISDERLRELIGDTKHRAHLNYVYGVIVEEALQYAVELDLAKERVSVAIKDPRDAEHLRDPLYERIYNRPRSELLGEFRAERGQRAGRTISLSELREFMYWLFKYRVKNAEPARVASDTRKALAQLSAIEDAVRRARTRNLAARAPEEVFASVD